MTRIDFSDKPAEHCSHASVVVSEATRTVECDECKASLDPFALLVEFARDDRLCYHEEFALESLRDESARLEKEIRGLKRQRARLRGEVIELGEKPEE